MSKSKFAFGSWHQRASKTTVTATAVIQAQIKGQPGGEPLQISTRRLACTCFDPPLLIANNKDPDENLLQQLPLRHSSATFLVSSPKYSSRIGPADRGTQPQHQSRRTMRKQHAINPKVLEGEMGFNPPFLAIESNSDQMQIKRPTPKHRNENVAHDAVQHLTFGRKTRA